MTLDAYAIGLATAPLASEALTAKELRDLVIAFTEALLFTEEPQEWSAQEAWRNADLAPEALARIIADCVSFAYSARPWFGDKATMEQIGHDFLLTRNGHGAGFWDRGTLYPEGFGDILTGRAKAYGELTPYLGDDGRIYV